MSDTRKIFLDKHCTIFCTVDAADFAWLIKWKWSWTKDRTGKKLYATRMTRSRKDNPKQIKVYMHKAILNHHKVEQPSEAHTIGDHGDGDSLMNTLGNLSWATPSMNRRTARRAT